VVSPRPLIALRALALVAATLAPAVRAEETPALVSSIAGATPARPAAASATEGSPDDEGAALPALLFEAGAYYTSVGLYLPLTHDPVPHVGEHGEVDMYWALLPRSPVPRFVVLEASVNPMPCLGLLVRDRDRSFYDRTQLDRNTNLLRAVTAGFEEPWAASLFVGNVVNFDVRDREDVQGKGYFGIVLSAGNWHIKDNVAIDDPWLESELKLKGDRRSPVKKLSWSFRVGVKLHANPDVVDTAYLGIRRSRVDYVDAPWYLANSGVEYRFDAALDGTPLRHFFLVDKKWPLRTVAPSIALGVLWDKGKAYAGRLAVDTPERVQILIRPNVEF
jgi:hypothetical protein